MTVYMNPETKLPPYLPLARFLLNTDLSMTAKIVYSLLLDRMTLSQKNGWADEDGHSYIIYPIERIAEDIGRGPSSVKTALAELSARSLIQRRRISFSAPNRIYVLLPDGSIPDLPQAGKQTGSELGIEPAESWENGGRTARSSTANHHIKNEPNKTQAERAKPLSIFGRYENVFLNDAEYISLKGEYPNTDSMIEQLSAYMQSKGRSYADHGAALRLWLERNKSKAAGIPDYDPKEGESL